VVELLVKAAPDMVRVPNSVGDTPIDLATGADNVEVAELLHAALPKLEL
jgi:hypothetical protein